MHFPDYRGSYNQINRNSTFAVQLPINSNVSLPPAAKRVVLINFSGPKRSIERRDGTDCMQRGTEVMRRRR